MTDAWATIIAAAIAALGTIVAAIVAVYRWPEKARRKAQVLLVGLIVGAVVGALVGFVLLQKPHPRARISEPIDGQSVPVHARVIIEYENIPPDRHLWVVVHIPKLRLPWLIYPQLQGRKKPLVGDGMIDITATLGGGSDSGDPFNIVALLVNEEANRFFTAYANDCARDPGLCNGMFLPDRGVVILDFNTVIRE